jgi:hypothetical protein
VQSQKEKEPANKWAQRCDTEVEDEGDSNLDEVESQSKRKRKVSIPLIQKIIKYLPLNWSKGKQV